MLGGLLSEQSIFHLAAYFLRKCESADIQFNYFSPKYPFPLGVTLSAGESCDGDGG